MATKKAARVRSVNASGRKLLQRTDWIKAGLAQLAAHGPDAVSIAAVSDKLGVTKGSFYWHFGSRDEFLQAILDDWALNATRRIIDVLEHSGSSAEEKIRRLARIGVSSSVTDYGGALELAMRTWARTDRKVRAAVAAVDEERLDYLRRLFSEALPGQDAELLACLHYSFSTGLRLMFSYSDDERLRLRQRALDEIFFRKTSPATANDAVTDNDQERPARRQKTAGVSAKAF